MENQRIVYIDALKGFAIFLMVFAHVIAWNFPDYTQVCIFKEGQDIHIWQAGFLWQLIYSFHMPLFFMISGYLSYKTTSFYLRKEIFKKTKRLFIPYCTTGFIILLVRPNYGYWFLLSLFELSILAVLVQKVLLLINKKQYILFDIVILALSYVVCNKVLNTHYLNSPFGDWSKAMDFYIPFFVGFLFKRHPSFMQICLKNITILMVVFFIIFVDRYIPIRRYELWGIPHRIICYLNSFFVLPIVASLIAIRIFKDGINKRTEMVFAYLGRQTLEIYILHLFFVLQIKSIGEFWLSSDLATCLASQIIYATFVSAGAILISILLSKVIKKSNFFAKILFGIY